MKPADLYSGAAGIAWFLIGIGRHTHNKAYLDAARKALLWAHEECRRGNVTDPGFYSGAAGIAFAMSCLWQATGEEECRALAVEAARNVSRALTVDTVQRCDLLGGAAGIAVALIHIHAMLGEDSLIGKIRDCRDMLIGGLRRGRVGCYWDRAIDQDRGLCGFGHGASGVGFALLEIGRYLRDETLYLLGREAFDYEDQYFDEHEQNWPDFRVDLSASIPTDQLTRSSDRPGSGRFMNAWCHGAPGIGIARLRATELRTEPGSALFTRSAVRKVLDSCVAATPGTSKFTLCHGFGGLAEMLLEAHRVLKVDGAMDAAHSIGRKIIDQRRQLGRYLPGGVSHPDLLGDPSLMNGSAGIGSFLLRLGGGSLTSILSPACYEKPPSREVRNGVALQDLARRFWGALFPRTIAVVDRLWPGQLGKLPPKWALAPSRSGQECFRNFISGRSIGLSHEQRTCIEEALALDLEIAELDLSIESNFQMYSRRMAVLKAASDLSASVRPESHDLLLNEDVTLRNTQWDWSSASQTTWADNALQEPGDYSMLLMTSALGVQDYRITRFSHEILEFFSNPATVEDAICHVTEYLLDNKNDEEFNIAKTVVIEQVQAAIRAGFLVVSPKSAGYERRLQ